MWTSDTYGILGSTRGVKLVYSLEVLVVSSYEVVTSNHISSGELGIVVSTRHTSTRPQRRLYPDLSLWITWKLYCSQGYQPSSFWGTIHLQLCGMLR